MKVINFFSYNQIKKPTQKVHPTKPAENIKPSKPTQVYFDRKNKILSTKKDLRIVILLLFYFQTIFSSKTKIFKIN